MNTYGRNRRYAIIFFLCEVTSLIMIILQVIGLNYLFSNEFLTYGLVIFKATNTDPMLRTDKMNQLFPKITECVLHNFNQDGPKPLRYKGMCVLNLNNSYEKIFLLIWLTYLIIIVCSVIYLFVTFLKMFSKSCRKCTLHKKLKGSMAGSMFQDFGDLFVVLQIKRNVDRSEYKKIHTELTNEWNRNYNRPSGIEFTDLTTV